MKLNYVKVNDKNLDIALKIQTTVWPNCLDKAAYLEAISKQDDKNVNFIVYAGNTTIGITGVYTENCDKKSIWLNWYCVLPDFRGIGYGKQILLYTIDYCRQFRDLDYFRVDTSFKMD